MTFMNFMNCCWLGWMTGTGKVAGHSDILWSLPATPAIIVVSFKWPFRTNELTTKHKLANDIRFEDESEKPRCMGFNLEGGQYVQEQRHGVILLILSRVRLRLLVNHWKVPNQYKQKDSANWWLIYVSMMHLQLYWLLPVHLCLEGKNPGAGYILHQQHRLVALKGLWKSRGSSASGGTLSNISSMVNWPLSWDVPKKPAVFGS